MTFYIIIIRIYYVGIPKKKPGICCRKFKKKLKLRETRWDAGQKVNQ